MAQVLENVEVETMIPTLLTEVEKQEQVLAELPDDYVFPLFNGRQAVESQRKSGYKNTPRAAREIVDNAFEAGAKQVHVAFRRAGDGGVQEGNARTPSRQLLSETVRQHIPLPRLPSLNPRNAKRVVVALANAVSVAIIVRANLAVLSRTAVNE